MRSIKLSLVIGFILAIVVISSFDKESMLNVINQTGFTLNNVEIPEEVFKAEFMNFIAEYGRSYQNSLEFQRRYAIFKDNYQKIINHNEDKEEHGFELAVNMFADLTNEEFKATHLGLKSSIRPSSFLKRTRSGEQRTYQDLPTKVDWRAKGYVNQPKDQGSCGSCWAFSTIASIESAFAIKTGTLPSLSEQQLVQCSKGFGNGGCSGGFMEYAFKYAEKYSLCSGDDYPYQGTDSKACTHDKCSTIYQLKGFTDLELNSRDALYAGIAQQPVSIGVCAGNIAWQFYKKGVMKRFCGDCLDHGVATVGYGNDDGDYIIVRNSWGSKWGENGYLRISSADKTGKGTCGIYQLPSIPIIE